MSKSRDPDIRDLWNDEITAESYRSADKYHDHIFEQYKIFVEMADKVSARRDTANAFFLTLHTLIIGAVTFLYEKGPNMPSGWLSIFPLLAVLDLCYLWWRLIRSYRQLNAAKYRVIGEFEKRLPSSPYWNAEWGALGWGMDRKLYWSLTDLEAWVPVLFALLYIAVFVAMAFF